eukprot:2811312-Alexandrium_andersonii.AAC.1
MQRRTASSAIAANLSTGAWPRSSSSTNCNPTRRSCKRLCLAARSAAGILRGGSSAARSSRDFRSAATVA